MFTASSTLERFKVSHKSCPGGVGQNTNERFMVNNSDRGLSAPRETEHISDLVQGQGCRGGFYISLHCLSNAETLNSNLIQKKIYPINDLLAVVSKTFKYSVMTSEL